MSEDTVSREEWRDLREYYVYRRQRLQLTRSPFHRLADGDPFFYALLLEKYHWRSEEEISGPHKDYRQQFLTLFPDEYADIIQSQKVAQHTYQLQYIALYDELVTAILENGPLQLQDVISSQLSSLRNSIPITLSSSNVVYDFTLHMGSDQYTAFSVLSSTFADLQNYHGQKFFFVTGSAGVGKSYLLSAIQQTLDKRRISYLKLAPTGIAAVNIQGQTIHSALSMTTSNFGDKTTSYVTSIFKSEEKQRELRKHHVLLIDEVSMVSAELLAFLSSTFSRLPNNCQPFGGVYVIAFGDLLQLPPVVGQTIFKSTLWRLFFPLFLTKSRRQEGDTDFI